MKERYFTPKNIQAKALEMVQALDANRRGQVKAFAPRDSALLALDMQAYFLQAGSHAFIPSAAAILPGVRDLARAYAKKELPVFFTRHVNTPQDAGMMAAWWRDLIAVDSPLSQIVPELDVSMGEVIEKSQYDAFYGTPLESRLRALGVKQVVIGGVMTHLCCETTARSAFVRGFQVFFLVDGTATYNQQFHQASLLNLSHGFATPMLVGEVLARLAEAG